MSKPREKQFLIVNSKVDDGKYEVKLFRNNTENSDLFTTFDSIHEAIDGFLNFNSFRTTSKSGKNVLTAITEWCKKYPEESIEMLDAIESIG